MKDFFSKLTIKHLYFPLIALVLCMVALLIGILTVCHRNMPSEYPVKYFESRDQRKFIEESEIYDTFLPVSSQPIVEATKDVIN